LISYIKVNTSKKMEGNNLKSDVRDVIAYIAGAYLYNKKAGSVYSYETGSYQQISGKFTDKKINVYDYRINKYISGTGKNDDFSLYHYGNNKHINIKFKGNKFEGYDYDSNKHFSGTVNNRSVTLYDYETSKYYDYSI
ncbi:hypothetical protein, partial [Planomicrobium sp. MB-3u-38]|uniref:hypothetical protein n=1 Tax=Planomicrobium sp. MB-3u-38 TaxID=2058318 RepID=UPI001E2DA3DC